MSKEILQKLNNEIDIAVDEGRIFKAFAVHQKRALVKAYKSGKESHKSELLEKLNAIEPENVMNRMFLEEIKTLINNK